MKTVAEQIGERIKRLRTGKGLSQAQVAKLCGWSGASRLANYESGTRNVGADDAIAIAKALGTTPSELLFGDSGDPSKWLSERQRKVLDLFNQLPDTDQDMMIDTFQLRLKEIDDYVQRYLRGRSKPADSEE